MYLESLPAAPNLSKLASLPPRTEFSKPLRVSAFGFVLPKELAEALGSSAHAPLHPGRAARVCSETLCEERGLMGWKVAWFAMTALSSGLVSRFLLFGKPMGNPSQGKAGLSESTEGIGSVRHRDWFRTLTLLWVFRDRVCLPEYMYVCTHVLMYVCMYVCTYVCLSVCMSVCLYV